MVLLKFMRKDVILRSVAPFKDDIFEGVVLTCYRIYEPQAEAPLGQKTQFVSIS
jgi:hypothetical protein